MLTVSNLAHLHTIAIPRLIDQFRSAFQVDMGADMEVSPSRPPCGQIHEREREI
jgi:hypothetical protein